MIVLDKGNGIIILDQFGNTISSLVNPGITFFQVLNDQLIYLNNESKLRFVGIYSQESNFVEIPQKDFNKALVLGKSIALIRDRRIEFYSFPR